LDQLLNSWSTHLEAERRILPVNIQEKIGVRLFLLFATSLSCLIIITITLSSAAAAAVLQDIKDGSVFTVMITASFPWPTYVSFAGEKICIH